MNAVNNNNNIVISEGEYKLWVNISLNAVNIIITGTVISEGDYKLWVKTASGSKPAGGGVAWIALYGELGHSEDIELTAPSARTGLFEPGNVDQFEVRL